MKNLPTFEQFINETAIIEKFKREKPTDVVFTINDEELDELLQDKFKLELEYQEVKGDSYYILPKKEFERFMDLADSSGFDIDYENSEDALVDVYESFLNESGEYKVKKGVWRDFDSLEITPNDRIQFKQDGDKWIVRVVTASDHTDKRAMAKLGFKSVTQGSIVGVVNFWQDNMERPVTLTKDEFDEIIKIVDSGWRSHAKSFADFYRNRQPD
jgi:hypothetical protein